MKFKIRSFFIYTCYLIAVTIVLLEIILRLYYPFQRKIRGDKWLLRTNIVYQLNNKSNPRLDHTVINRRNSIGFRGEDPTGDMSKRFSILTVGGSTTACTFLTEGKTWTDRLGATLQENFSSVWINNAGLDGHSTYGNLNFLYHYLPTLPFTPKVIVFLIGANDVDRNDLSFADTSLSTHNRLVRWLETHSETVSFLIDLKWIIHPVDIFKNSPNWSFWNSGTVHFTGTYIDSALKRQELILPAFKKRLYNLVEQCNEKNIVPVFVTQPLVFGDGTVQGGNPAIDFDLTMNNDNGVLFFRKLTLYNQVIRKVAAGTNTYCIDLAGKMPKDTSYYYDMVHYTNAGAEKVADILFEKLNPYLSERFPQYLRH